MITLGDVPLLIPDSGGELVRWLNRYLPLAELNAACDVPTAVQSHRTAGRTMVRAHNALPIPNWPAPPRPRLNSLYWPTGATRWARGYFLATGEAADEIYKAAGYGSQSGMTDVKLKMGDEGEDGDPDDHKWVLETNVWLLTAIPVSSLFDDPLFSHDDGGQSASGDEEDNLWVIPVVDERYLWQFLNVDDLEVTTSTTWANLLTTLGTALGVTVSHETPHADYLQPDPLELTRRRDNAAVLLDAVALSIGQRVVRKLDGTVKLQDYSTAATAFDENLAREWRLVAGGGGDTGDGLVPAKTVVTFPEYIDRIIKSGGELQVKETDAPSGTDGTVSAKKKVIHSTCYADMPVGGGATPDNDTKIEDLAAQINTDYYGWLEKRYIYVLVGMFGWQPCGYDDAVVWEFGTPIPGGDGEAGKLNAITRVWSLPTNFGVETQLSQDPDLSPLFGEQLGKATLDIAMGAAGTIEIYDRDGATTSLTVTDAIARGHAIEQDLWVTLAPIDDRWHIGCYQTG